MVLQDAAVCASASSVTVSARALNACCFLLICTFGLISTNMQCDIGDYMRNVLSENFIEKQFVMTVKVLVLTYCLWGPGFVSRIAYLADVVFSGIVSS